MPISATSSAQRKAVEQLVSGFSAIPARWFEDKIRSLPIWGTLFLVNDGFDARRIESLFEAIDREDYDIERNVLHDAGWQSVGSTGLIAIVFDDEILIGVHGVGYDFYEYHWGPLYEALGYRWHDCFDFGPV